MNPDTRASLLVTGLLVGVLGVALGIAIVTGRQSDEAEAQADRLPQLAAAAARDRFDRGRELLDRTCREAYGEDWFYSVETRDCALVLYAPVAGGEQ